MNVASALEAAFVIGVVLPVCIWIVVGIVRVTIEMFKGAKK